MLTAKTKQSIKRRKNARRAATLDQHANRMATYLLAIAAAYLLAHLLQAAINYYFG